MVERRDSVEVLETGQKVGSADQVNAEPKVTPVLPVKVTDEPSVRHEHNCHCEKCLGAAPEPSGRPLRGVQKVEDLPKQGSRFGPEIDPLTGKIVTGDPEAKARALGHTMEKPSAPGERKIDAVARTDELQAAREKAAEAQAKEKEAAYAKEKEAAQAEEKAQARREARRAAYAKNKSTAKPSTAKKSTAKKSTARKGK